MLADQLLSQTAEHVSLMRLWPMADTLRAQNTLHGAYATGGQTQLSGSCRNYSPRVHGWCRLLCGDPSAPDLDRRCLALLSGLLDFCLVLLLFFQLFPLPHPPLVAGPSLLPALGLCQQTNQRQQSQCSGSDNPVVTVGKPHSFSLCKRSSAGCSGSLQQQCTLLCLHRRSSSLTVKHQHASLQSTDGSTGPDM